MDAPTTSVGRSSRQSSKSKKSKSKKTGEITQGAQPNNFYVQRAEKPAWCGTVSPNVQSGCQRVLQVQHNERWQAIPGILLMMGLVGKHHGFELAHPYVSGGSLVPAGLRIGIPLSTYFDSAQIARCDPKGLQTIRLRLKRESWERHSTSWDVADSAAELPQPFWCAAGQLCVPDWTMCSKKCSLSVPDALKPGLGKVVPWGLMGRIIRDAFDFVSSECPGASLLTPSGGLWYKFHQSPPESQANKQLSEGFQFTQRLSPGMYQAATRIVDLYLRCPKGTPQVAAMLRLAPQPLFKKPPQHIEALCRLMLNTTNRLAELVQPRRKQTCQHFLATDYAVAADSGMSKQHSQAMRRCFDEELHAPVNSSRWFTIGHREIAYGASGSDVPDKVKRAFGSDPAGAHAILELAILARADVCIEKSHMAQTIASQLRSGLGKPPCHNMKNQNASQFVLTHQHLSLAGL